VVVVDASAMAAVVFGEPAATAVLDAIEGEDLCAPELLRYELTNIARSKTLSGRSNRAAVREMLLNALTLPVRYVSIDFGDVLELAVGTRLSVYDASYLWLSRRLGMPLVTLDKRLAAHAKRL
jgi:predicted nucleic acid-binding protein